MRIHFLSLCIASFFITASPACFEAVLNEVVIRSSAPEVDADTLREILELQFLGHPLDKTMLRELKGSAACYLQQEHAPLMYVAFPSQNISSGVLEITIDKSRVGNVFYNETRWVKTSFLKEQFAVNTGDEIDLDRLQDKAAWLNRNPFHYTEIVLAAGQKKGTTDIDVVTKDRFPWNFYVGVDNTGTQFTDQIRLFTGFTWGNAFGIDDLLTFQFTSAPDFNTFNSYTLDYTSFLPWEHSLSLYGGYAQLHPTITNFRSEGRDGQASLRYNIPIKPLYKSLLQEVTIGVDYKIYNSALFFEAEIPVPIANHNTNLTQLMLAYRLQKRTAKDQAFLRIEGYASPLRWLPNQNKETYGDLRPHSLPQYAYVKAALGDLHKFKHFACNFLARGQYSGVPLLPSEQFGLGGFNTVRGYEELAFNADSAACLNFEIHSPSLSLCKVKNELYFLAFADYGYGHNCKVEGGLPSHQYLLGVGPGLRYKIRTNLTARLDYGFNLHHILNDSHYGRFHFSGILSY